MTWSERTTYFERLVELRLRYSTSGEQAAVLSIDDAMIYAAVVLEASAIEDECWFVTAEADEANLHEPACIPRSRTILCTVDEVRSALERLPKAAGSAGGPAGRGERAAD